jgi:hypothetical protein
MKFGQLRRRIEMHRWEVEHPEYQMYHERIGCCTPLLMTVAVIFILVACKAREVIVEKPVEVPHYIHDTLEVKVKETETVHVTDSMWIKGDTVFKYRDRFREYVVHDTVLSITRDTIGMPVYLTKTEYVEVEKQLTWWQEGAMWLGGLVVLLVIGWFVSWLARRFRH